MAIETPLNIVRYDGNNSTTEFDFSFLVYNSTHLVVTVDGDVLTDTIDYDVTGIGDANGGTVTTVIAPDNGNANVVLTRVVPVTQISNYPEANKFPSGQVEKDFDLRTMVEQQIYEVLSRTITIRATDVDGNHDFIVVGNADERANKNLVFSGDGQGVELGTPAISFLGAWVTATFYAVGTVVEHSGTVYMCLIEHTSGVFATDLAAVKWTVFGINVTGMVGSNNLSEITNAATARVNLGLTDAYYQSLESIIPVGTIVDTLLQTAPNSWVFMDGTALNASTAIYSRLFTSIVWNAAAYGKGTALGTVTADETTDFFTLALHGLTNGDLVHFATTGGLPAGITANTAYYVVNKTSNTFQVSLTSGGAPVNFTTNGTGTNSVYNKFIPTDPRGRGRIATGTGAGLTARAAGAVLGTEDGTLGQHLHTAAAVSVVTDPGHVHTVREAVGSSGATHAIVAITIADSAATGSGLVDAAVTGVTVATSVTVDNTGSSLVGVNMPPVNVYNVMVKL